MKGLLEVILGGGALMVVAAFTAVVRDEVPGQLGRLPFVLLRLARRRVPEELRVRLHDEEWQPELHHIMSRAGASSISRLLSGTMFALGLLRAARSISRQRAELAAPDIELRRLISLSSAVDAVGNIATGVAGYALTFAIGFTVGAGFVNILGICTTVLWLPMRVFLFLVFGIALGLAYGLVASLGFRAGFRYIAVSQKIRWISRAAAPAPPSSRFVWLISAFAKFFTAVNGIVRLPGMVAATSWPAGAALGLFALVSFGHIISSVMVATVVIVAASAIRLFVVTPLRWVYQRRHARLIKNPER
jgi:hypothetical protein